MGATRPALPETPLKPERAATAVPQGGSEPVRSGAAVESEPLPEVDRAAAVGSEPLPGVDRLAAVESEPLPEVDRLAAMADQLVGRFPGRVLLVRSAPAALASDGAAAVLVVVDADPAAMRPTIEAIAGDHWPDGAVALHLMEREGYRVLQAVLAETSGDAPEAATYRAPSMPRGDRSGARERRRRDVERALQQAERHLRLAHVLVDGGFPDETAPHARAALGGGLAVLMQLGDDGSVARADLAALARSSQLPSARAVHARLVEPGHLPPDLAARISDVRALTEPPDDGDQVAEPLTASAAGGVVATVDELLVLARERLAKAAIGEMPMR